MRSIIVPALAFLLALATSPSPNSDWIQTAAAQDADESEESAPAEDAATEDEGPAEDASEEEAPAKASDEQEAEREEAETEGEAGAPPAAPAQPGLQFDDELTTPLDETEPAEGEAESAAESSEGGEKSGSVAALGAGSPMVAEQEGAKPWTVSLNAGFGVASSAFAGGFFGGVAADGFSDIRGFTTVSGESTALNTGGGDGFATTQGSGVPLTYNASAVGLYKLTKLWQGRLDGFMRVGFNGVFNGTFTGSGFGEVTENPFFFEDIRIGLLGRGLYTWKGPGLIFGSNLLFSLPTGDLSRATDRILRTDLTANMTKVFSKVGPANLILGLSQSFRYDIGPSNPTLDLGESPSRVLICDEGNTGDSCFSTVSAVDWGATTTATARYLMNFGLNFNFQFSLLYLQGHDLRGGTLEEPLTASQGGSEIEVQDSVNSTTAAPGSLLHFTSISVGYAITSHWSVSTGLSTFQPILVQRGDNSSSPSNPFFANDPETNATTWFTNVGFTY